MLQFKVLIVSPDHEWSQNAFVSLEPCFIGELVANGKDAQLKIYKENFDYVFIDLATSNNSALEVLRYIHNGFPKIKAFAFRTQADTEVDIDEARLSKMGAILIAGVMNPKDINLPVRSLGKIKKWQEISEVTVEDKDETEISITDTQFTRIKIDELFEDSIAIFDFYIRLGSNKYIKIIHKGERASGEQIKRYAQNGAKFLYFLSEERADFIGYQNDLTGQMLKKENPDGAKILKVMKTVADKYIEEIHVQGIQPHLVEEGKVLCQNMYDLVNKDESLRKLLGRFEEFDPAAYSHSFLVSFFTTVISKNLPWVGAKTREALSLSSLFHDIGLMELPQGIISKKYEDMSLEELQLFKQHPHKGIASLNGIPLITGPVLQTVLQHHETNDGEGYPAGLSGNRIYPMAKVLSLADSFSELLIAKECSPREGLHEFLSNRINLVRYDSELVKGLVKGFVSEKK